MIALCSYLCIYCIYTDLQYSIHELEAGDNKLLPFKINPTTGEITTTKRLDYERVQRYDLYVIASSK